jgi:biopolymer transport protein ExbD
MKRRGSDSVETPVASLIDVVFLLIIFFVVTASVEKDIVDTSIELARAESVKPEQKKNPLTIIINVRKDGSYNIAKQPMRLQQIYNILYSTMTKYGVEVPILIRADGNAEYRAVADLQETITKVGFYKVRLAALAQ